MISKFHFRTRYPRFERFRYFKHEVAYGNMKFDTLHAAISIADASFLT